MLELLELPVRADAPQQPHHRPRLLHYLDAHRPRSPVQHVHSQHAPPTYCTISTIFLLVCVFRLLFFQHVRRHHHGKLRSNERARRCARQRLLFHASVTFAVCRWPRPPQHAGRQLHETDAAELPGYYAQITVCAATVTK